MGEYYYRCWVNWVNKYKVDNRIISLFTIEPQKGKSPISPIHPSGKLLAARRRR
jgi:hypothetical protein